MGITVEFKDFNEMMGFAIQLVNGKTAATAIKTDKPKVEPQPSENKNNTPEVTEQKEEPVKAYTLEEVRAVLAKLTRSGKQKQVKALLTSLGAKNLSSVDPKDYAALMEKAGEI